jgi:hypothetical protein
MTPDDRAEDDASGEDQPEFTSVDPNDGSADVNSRVEADTPNSAEPSDDLDHPGPLSDAPANITAALAMSVPALDADSDDPPDPQAAADEHAGPGIGLRDLIDRVLTRKSRHIATVEAENERVLTLRDEVPDAGLDAEALDDAAEPLCVELELPSPRAGGFIIFRNGAAHTEKTVLISGEIQELALGLGARLQVWQRGDAYLLQHIGGAPISVGGAPLRSPIIVLDDGDELTCDGEVLRFNIARATILEDRAVNGAQPQP